MKHSKNRVPALLLGALVSSLLVLPAGTCASGPADKTPVLSRAAPDDSWASLTPDQKKSLAPLASQWHTLDGTSRDKWITLANRFPHLSPAEQQRLQARMTQWSQLPAQQRGEARLRFQNTRQLSPAERQQSWAAYQALSPEERRELAQQARRKQKPVVLPATEPGPREAGQQIGSRQRDRKANLVPGTHAGAAREVVAPTVVKAGRGATTSLVTQTARPPLHQQAGLPKINTAKGFVDEQTLLPRKGVQGAGMTPPQPQPQPQPPLERAGGKGAGRPRP